MNPSCKWPILVLTQLSIHVLFALSSFPSKSKFCLTVPFSGIFFAPQLPLPLLSSLLLLIGILLAKRKQRFKISCKSTQLKWRIHRAIFWTAWLLVLISIVTVYSYRHLHTMSSLHRQITCATFTFSYITLNFKFSSHSLIRCLIPFI